MLKPGTDGQERAQPPGEVSRGLGVVAGIRGGWHQGTVWSGHLGRGVQAGSLTPSEVSVDPVLDFPSEVTGGGRGASKA